MMHWTSPYRDPPDAGPIPPTPDVEPHSTETPPQTWDLNVKGTSLVVTFGGQDWIPVPGADPGGGGARGPGPPPDPRF